MQKLPIVMVNDLDLLNANHALKQKSIPVNLDESVEAKRAQHVVREMFRTLYAEPSGIALAAPQVGILLPIIVVDFEDKETTEKHQLALINPVIVENSNEMMDDQEICLSLPGRSGVVPRFATITVHGFDQHFHAVTIQAEGYYARVLQHEIDHVNGTLYIERAQGEISHIPEFHDRRAKVTLKKLNMTEPL